MKKDSIRYWDSAAKDSPRGTRGAILDHFTDPREFDLSGKEDAENLVLPFVATGDRVLDLGCGVGRMLKWVARNCRCAVGADISSQMLKKAAQHLRGLDKVELRRIPISLRLPFRRETFDFIYFFHVSDHLEREDTFTLLTEIRRCLRPRGGALVQFSLLDHPDNRAEFLKWAGTDDSENVRSRFYSEAEVTLMLAMARLAPQIRIYVPGELNLVVCPEEERELGQMPVLAHWSSTRPQST